MQPLRAFGNGFKDKRSEETSLREHLQKFTEKGASVESEPRLLTPCTSRLPGPRTQGSLSHSGPIHRTFLPGGTGIGISPPAYTAAARAESWTRGRGAYAT